MIAIALREPTAKQAITFSSEFCASLTVTRNVRVAYVRRASRRQRTAWQSGTRIDPELEPVHTVAQHAASQTVERAVVGSEPRHLGEAICVAASAEPKSASHPR
jgi:hypothetical protein